MAIFAFMNRNDSEVKLHPIVLYEGSDSRQNLEITLGTYTKEIRNMEGKEITLGSEQVKIKLFGLFDLFLIYFKHVDFAVDNKIEMNG